MPKRKIKIRTTSDVLDEMHDIRTQYRALDEESNALKAQYSELQEELIGLFDADGVDQARTESATASLREEVIARIKDPKAFWTWVGRYKKWYLVQNRISNPSYREEMTKRIVEIPGLESYTKRSISLRDRK